MFCKNCGKELNEGVRFCDNCGTQLESVPQSQQNATTSATKSNSKGKRTGGIIMAVLGGLSVLGSFANDYYWNITHNGVYMSDVVVIGIQIGLIVAGAYLIYKSKK